MSHFENKMTSHETFPRTLVEFRAGRFCQKYARDVEKVGWLRLQIVVLVNKSDVRT